MKHVLPRLDRPAAAGCDALNPKLRAVLGRLFELCESSLLRLLERGGVTLWLRPAAGGRDAAIAVENPFRGEVGSACGGGSGGDVTAARRDTDDPSSPLAAAVPRWLPPLLRVTDVSR